jgi:hypothetical protein
VLNLPAGFDLSGDEGQVVMIAPFGRRDLYLWVTVLLLALPRAPFANAWIQLYPHRVPTRHNPSCFSLYQSSDSQSQVNGQSSGGLITAADSKSQLFNAFAALDLNDQYDAVLTGLCANKILDDASVSPAGAREALEDPLQLLREMNQKRIQASPRSLMALIDVSSLRLFCQSGRLSSHLVPLCSLL